MFSPDFLSGNKTVFFSILLFFVFSVKAQMNLVPNGSFEEYYSCPTANDLNDGQFELCKYWWKPTMGTPDYFNRCNNGVVGVPNNLYGHQEPFQGDGYVGLVPIEWDLENNYVGNEYIRAKLLSPLNPCTEYHFKMYVSLANKATHGVTKLGAFFSKNNDFSNTWLTIYEIPQIIYDQLPIIDTSNWTKIEGTFKAQGFEEFITIGYFKDNVNLDTISIQDWGFGSAPYYYIDSVSLTKVYEKAKEPCDFYLEIPNVFTPNNDGTNDVIDLSKYLDFIDKVRIINRWGNTIKVLTKDNPIWDGSNCVDGIYYYLIEDEKLKIKQNGFIHLIR